MFLPFMVGFPRPHPHRKRLLRRNPCVQIGAATLDVGLLARAHGTLCAPTNSNNTIPMREITVNPNHRKKFPATPCVFVQVQGYSVTFAFNLLRGNERCRAPEKVYSREELQVDAENNVNSRHLDALPDELQNKKKHRLVSKPGEKTYRVLESPRGLHCCNNKPKAENVGR